MTLAAAFRKGNGRKVSWNGRTVHRLMRVNVTEGDRFEIERVGASATRAQAIKLACDKGDLRANGVVAPVLAIWSHTAPESLTVEVTGRRTRSVDVWNTWSYEGVDSAWIGNSGMLVEQTGSTHLIRCSDGLGEPNFDDLVVRIRHERVQ